jgi:hypothetical protein
LVYSADGKWVLNARKKTSKANSSPFNTFRKPITADGSVALKAVIRTLHLIIFLELVLGARTAIYAA